jgi:TusA-related sulfurtransferase
LAVHNIAMRLGHAFVGAIVAGDFDRLETLLAPDLRFRALIPDDYVQAVTATGAREVVQDWFGDTDQRELVGSTVEMVGDRLALGYRLELTEDGERRVVEQHVAAIIESGLFRDVTLVCSGFRRLVATIGSTVGTARLDASADGDQAPELAFAPAARLDATGLSCATLTPTISASVRALDFGTILEIVTDDPDAEEGLRSWARLTGNELVDAEAGLGSARRFAIRRSPRPAATETREGTN